MSTVDSPKKPFSRKRYALLVVMALYVLALLWGSINALLSLNTVGPNPTDKHEIGPKGGLNPPLTPPVTGTLVVDSDSVSKGKLFFAVFFLVTTLVFAGWAFASHGTKRLALTLASAGSLAMTVTSSASFIKDLKVDTLFKFDKLSFNLNITDNADTARVLQGGGGIERLGCIGFFETGASELQEPLASSNRCDTKESSPTKSIGEKINGRKKDIVAIVLIGSADRQPLVGHLLRLYDSNMGLARARAEWARTALKVDGAPFLVLTTGPGETAIESLVKDRSVDVWVVWRKSESVPVPAVR